jgi:AcrR family transcriptional regulator
MILVTKNAIPRGVDVASRIAAETLAKRGPDYESEVRRLLDAALEVIAKHGTTARARVADIVATAGLSNDAFYRHFPSKDALVGALIEDGTQRLVSYVAHQMDKASTPEDKVRRWVEGVLSQTKEETATTTLAVVWNGSSFDTGTSAGSHNAAAPIAALLHEPLAALGSANPELDASLAAHAVMGKLSDYLWARTRPSKSELDHMAQYFLRGASA